MEFAGLHITLAEFTICNYLIQEVVSELIKIAFNSVIRLVPSNFPTPPKPQIGLKMVAQIDDGCVVCRPRN